MTPAEIRSITQKPLWFDEDYAKACLLLDALAELVEACNLAQHGGRFAVLDGGCVVCVALSKVEAI